MHRGHLEGRETHWISHHEIFYFASFLFGGEGGVVVVWEVENIMVSFWKKTSKRYVYIYKENHNNNTNNDNNDNNQ